MLLAVLRRLASRRAVALAFALAQSPAMAQDQSGDDAAATSGEIDGILQRTAGGADNNFLDFA